MNKFIVVLILSVALVVVFSGIGICASNVQPKKDVEKVQTQPKVEAPSVQKTVAPAAVEAVSEKNAQPKSAGTAAKSKDELIADIINALRSEDEIFNAVPGLKADKDAKGNIFYTYNGTKIEDLSKEDAGSLTIKVHQARTRLNTERIQRQLETVRRMERLQRINAPSQTPRTPAAPMTVRTPPPAPVAARAPTPPPSTPRTPPSVPQVPSRR
ncbi:MAG: hypothetical protein Q7S30_05405 [Candidatus Omnitrophota bacterium]|nr:hypothetical protein [Candidatus Omnitrophota bacterium]